MPEVFPFLDADRDRRAASVLSVNETITFLLKLPKENLFQVLETAIEKHTF